MKTGSEYQSVAQFLLADVWYKDNANNLFYHRIEKRCELSREVEELKHSKTDCSHSAFQ